jgi:predicted membrane-bound dolichyl-phosphate-mannose-protein mannosyltransferase
MTDKELDRYFKQIIDRYNNDRDDKGLNKRYFYIQSFDKPLEEMASNDLQEEYDTVTKEMKYCYEIPITNQEIKELKTKTDQEWINWLNS